jgi:hypothetical protein
VTKSDANVTGPRTVKAFNVMPGDTLKVPPLDVKGPVPSAVALPKTTLAAFKFTPPVKLLSPARVIVPVPPNTNDPVPEILFVSVKLELLLKLIAPLFSIVLVIIPTDAASYITFIPSVITT